MQIDFRAPAVIADPFPALAQLRAHDPVHWSEQLGSWVLTRYEDVALAFRDERFSAERIAPFIAQAERANDAASRALGAHIALWAVFTDPPRHTRLRKLMSSAFTPAAIHALRPRIEAIVNELIDARIDHGSMDVIADFSYPLPATVIGEMLGVPRSDLDLLKRWSDDIAAFVLVSRATSDKYRRAAASIEEMTRYFAGIVAARRSRSEGKVIDQLIAAQAGQDAGAGERLTLEELLAACVLLLFAGHETTTHFIGNGLLALLRQPEQMQALRAHLYDADYVANALHEMLRWDGPTLSMARVVREDIALHGERLAAGERVYLFAAAANRDETVFSAAERFDLARPNARRHLTFGYGIHTCLGAQLARVEGEIAFTQLLRRTQEIALAQSAPEWSDSLVIRGLKALPVSFRAAPV